MRSVSDPMPWPGPRALLLATVVVGACTTTAGQATSELAPPAGCIVRETSRPLLSGKRESTSSHRSLESAQHPSRGATNYIFSAGATTDERTISAIPFWSRGHRRGGKAVPAPIDRHSCISEHALSRGRWAVVFRSASPGEPPRPTRR